MRIEALALTAALAFAACGGKSSSPTQPSTPTPTPSTPTPPTPTAPAPSAVTNWNVTQRFGSVTGPDIAWIRQQRQTWTGAVFPDLPMAVTRSGGVINLDSGYFQVNYTGTFSGSDFSATGREPLEGNAQQMPGVSRLSGRFSVDDQQLTATETNTYRLVGSGETVTYTWEWQVTRRD